MSKGDGVVLKTVYRSDPVGEVLSKLNLTLLER